MPSRPPDADRLAAAAIGELLDVSRETLERFAAYLDVLSRWQGAINLVGPATLADPWRRHILDCGQLWRHWPSGARRLVDLGSGAGLPGLILAIMGVPEAHLVESDRRKASFLREAARVCEAEVTVHAARSEAMPPLAADVISARALAPLPELLTLCAPHGREHTTALFLKGRGADAELALARTRWTMHAVSAPSLSDPSGRVLILTGVRRAASPTK